MNSANIKRIWPKILDKCCWILCVDAVNEKKCISFNKIEEVDGVCD